MYVTIINEKNYEFVKEQGGIYGKFSESKEKHKFCNYIKSQKQNKSRTSTLYTHTQIFTLLIYFLVVYSYNYVFQKHAIFLSIIFVRKILYFLKFYSNTC